MTAIANASVDPMDVVGRVVENRVRRVHDVAQFALMILAEKVELINDDVIEAAFTQSLRRDGNAESDVWGQAHVGLRISRGLMINNRQSPIEEGRRLLDALPKPITERPEGSALLCYLGPSFP